MTIKHYLLGMKHMENTHSLPRQTEDIQCLFLMTPHYWTSSIKGKDQLAKHSHLELTIDMNFKLYKYSV